MTPPTNASDADASATGEDGPHDPRPRAAREAEAVEAIWPGPGRPRLSCQSPSWDVDAVACRTLTVEGWAIGSTGPPTVTIELAGRRWEAGLGFPRPDVLEDFPEPGAERSGWRATITVPPGPLVRRLAVTATDPSGSATSVTRHVRVAAGEPYRRWLDRREPIAPGPRRLELDPLDLWIAGGDDDSAAARTWASLRRQEEAGWSPIHADRLHEVLQQLSDGRHTAVLIVAAGDALEPHAVRAVAERLAQGHADLVYADDDRADDEGGRGSPRFKPQWSPELLLARDYVGRFVAVRPRAARAALAAGSEPIGDLDELLLRLVDEDLWVERIPDVLVTRAQNDTRSDGSRRRMIEAVARRRRAQAAIAEVGSGVFDVGWRPRGEPRVSVVVVTALHRQLLGRCLDTLVARSAGYRDLEVIVVHHGEGEIAPLLTSLRDVDHQVVSAHEPFNYSRLNNLGAQSATGDYLFFLNDDVEFDSDDWVRWTLGQCEQPGVGIVGVKMLFPNGLVNHGGVLVDPDRELVRASYSEFAGDDPGHDHDLLVARDTAAVGTAGAMISRRLFDEIGGFDEGLEVELGDIDLSLRARAIGRRVVWTPRVTLIHHERASRGRETFPSDAARFGARWARLLQARDPFWSPHLQIVPQGELVEQPPSRASAQLMESRLESDGPPVRPVALPVPHVEATELRPSAERFVPETMSGTHMHAEHEARYRWAAPLAEGRAVLDAGCGVGYGARILLDAGARAAVGVDVSPHAIADAQTLHGTSGPEYVVGDLLNLPLDDASFDLAVCFEAIEHVADAARVLDELRRVLRPGGVLVVSSPNRGVYPEGNPHHLHELTPAELGQLLAGRFAHVGVFRQDVWAATVIADLETIAHPKSDADGDVSLRIVRGRPPGTELYTLAVASDQPIPPVARLGVAASDRHDDDHRWLADYHGGLLKVAERELAQARARADDLEVRLARADAGNADITASASWRITAPLRRAKGFAHPGLPPRLLAARGGLARTRAKLAGAKRKRGEPIEVLADPPQQTPEHGRRDAC